MHMGASVGEMKAKMNEQTENKSIDFDFSIAICLVFTH